jgi:hypothetical protein
MKAMSAGVKNLPLFLLKSISSSDLISLIFNFSRMLLRSELRWILCKASLSIVTENLRLPWTVSKSQMPALVFSFWSKMLWSWLRMHFLIDAAVKLLEKEAAA